MILNCFRKAFKAILDQDLIKLKLIINEKDETSKWPSILLKNRQNRNTEKSRILNLNAVGRNLLSLSKFIENILKATSSKM